VIKYDLTPLVFESKAVVALEAEAKRRGVVVPVHVEVDTGMNRLGVEPENALEFCRRIAASEHLTFDGIMTHFAAADDPHDDDFTRQQIALFEQVIADLAHAEVVPRVVHAANTAAAWRFPQARYDMVRVGLGLYGVHPSPDVEGEAVGISPALEFVTEITHVKTVLEGESVGYGRSFRPDEARRIATIAAGYNDGLPRFMSNGGHVLVRGVRCPVVGNVCMDVSMVDVTDVPDATAGDEVVIFGQRGDQEVTVDELALRGDTISYEILTNISPRVRRIFRR
jgi:alanine racemase